MTSSTNTAGSGRILVTPDDLIERFCHPADVGSLATPTLRDGVLTCQGFCGYEGGHGDSLVVGFDEGYDFIDYLAARGWTPLHDKGDWPFQAYLAFDADGVRALVGYTEGDLTISQFDNEDHFKKFLNSIS